MQHAGLNGVVAFDFLRRVVRGRAALFYRPDTGGLTCDIEDRFGEHRLARPLVPEQGHIAYVVGCKVLHALEVAPQR